MKKIYIICLLMLAVKPLPAQNFLDHAFHWVLPYELNLYENYTNIIQTDETEFYLEGTDTIINRKESRKFNSAGQLVERSSAYATTGHVITSWVIDRITYENGKIRSILTLQAYNGKADTTAFKQFQYVNDILKTVTITKANQKQILVFEHKQGVIEQKSYLTQLTDRYPLKQEFLLDANKRLQAFLTYSRLDNKTVTEKEEYAYDKKGLKVKYVQYVGEEKAVNDCAIYTYDSLKRNIGVLDCDPLAKKGIRYAYQSDEQQNWVIRRWSLPSKEMITIRQIKYRNF